MATPTKKKATPSRAKREMFTPQYLGAQPKQELCDVDKVFNLNIHNKRTKVSSKQQAGSKTELLRQLSTMPLEELSIYLDYSEAPLI